MVYCEAVHNLLKIYATGDIVSETDASMMQFTQPLNKLATEYSEALWNNALRCERVNDEYVLKGVLIEGLLESIRHTMHSYWK